MTYDPITHKCTRCGLLTTKEGFKLHPQKECDVIKFKRELVEMSIFGEKEFVDKGAGI